MRCKHTFMSCMEAQSKWTGDRQAKMPSIASFLTELRKDPALKTLEGKIRLLNVHVPCKDLNTDQFVYLGTR